MRVLSLRFCHSSKSAVDSNGNVVTLSAGTTPSLTLAQTSVSVPVRFMLAGKSNAGVVLDFDVSKSLTTDNQANFVLTPTVVAAVAGPTDAIPQLIDCAGTITAVAKDDSGFDIQLAESAATVHIDVTPCGKNATSLASEAGAACSCLRSSFSSGADKSPHARAAT